MELHDDLFHFGNYSFNIPQEFFIGIKTLFYEDFK
jgi:hypothetical protein